MYKKLIGALAMIALLMPTKAFHLNNQHLQFTSTRSNPITMQMKPYGKNTYKEQGLMNRKEAISVGKIALLASLGSVLLPSKSLADPENINAFNGLAFGYRGSEFGGLDASTLNEPSIPYKEFLEKLSSGNVAYVEFLAPNGDVAYVTLKNVEGKDAPRPIRIGEGYPVEQSNGWSSPAFVIRSVKDKGVPYKFVFKK